METGTEFGANLTLGIMVNSLMQFLKGFDAYRRFVTAFPAADKWGHRFVAATAATFSTLGIVVAFQGDAATGWHLGADIPNLEALAHAAWTWVQIFAFQQYAYNSSNARAVTSMAPPTERRIE